MRVQKKKRLSNPVLGLIFVIVLGIASYAAFTKSVPWGGGTELKVAFASAQNLRPNSPVRIAGVNVGTVKSVEPLAPGDGTSDEADGAESTVPGALVTMEVNDDALPLKEDAQFELRPRLFLEGNLFVDIRPGSPAAPAVDSDYVFPPQQTTNSVQLDQVLTGALQGDARADLQIFLDQFGKALIDEGGAESFRTLYKVSPGAYKYTSQVNEAILGQNPHDLSGLIVNLDTVVRGLGRDETALKDLITNFRVFSGSFAAQDQALEQAIIELPQVLEAADPAFANLNAAFPPLRAFAREVLPGTLTAPSTLRAATPLLHQINGLASRAELRGLVADLVPAVPRLARLSRKTVPFLEQARALSSCFNNVIIPWSNDKVDGGMLYDHPAVGRVFEETGYGLAGINGESRSGDANGQYIRVGAGGGTNTIESTTSTGETFAGVSPFPILGSMPAVTASAKTPFKPNKPCENQDPPDLRSNPGPAPTQTTVPAGAAPTQGEAAKIMADSASAVQALADAAEAKKAGDTATAKELGKQALKQMRQFYSRYGN